MKKIIFFFAMIFCTSAYANFNVVLVSPRGETRMETLYKEELQRLLTGKRNIAFIPVETIQKFVHVVNLCTANTLRQYPSIHMFRTGEIILPKPTPEDEGCVSFD